ncbi:LacI family DNA-binding transcriptional regulator [Furfurilactobacillus entadae]|uniref:LacI family DNA-binding transcriptional regulator n=1 Tax=Furfurilactobacillus entadae TaxID=2922307 RepID=UPI0035ED1ECB
MTNIHGIAKKSGYSPATVSRVINHKKYVSTAAQKKIEQVMLALDYTPNAVARDLSRGNTHNIGVVLPHSHHPYFSKIVTGLMDAALSADYQLVLLPSKYDQAIELTYLEQLHQHAFDALIFVSHGLPTSKLASYQKYGRIVCCFNPEGNAIPASYVDRDAAYIEAFTWIKQHHFNKVGILLSRNSRLSATSQSMHRAYQQVFNQPIPAALIYTPVVTDQDGYKAGAYYTTHRLAPNFIFGNGDDIIASTRQYYLDHHLPMPGLMGQEHQLSSQLLEIPTIDHHFEEVGRAAFELALSGKQEHHKIDSTFIDYTSI